MGEDEALDHLAAHRPQNVGLGNRFHRFGNDFGTGYSNLARLRAMPLDRVKLDPSLIADIETSDKARIVVQAVVQLIKGVGAEIVAEAVENSAQADILRAMGCETVQGFVFAHPMFEDEYLSWTENAGRGSRSVA